MERQEKIKLLNALRHGDIVTLLESELPKIDYHIDKLIPEGLITTFFGPSQQFKSTFALYLALCISTGRDTFHYKHIKKGKILWVDEEMGVVGLKTKIQQLKTGLNIINEELKDNFKYISMMNVKLDTEKGLNFIKAYLLKYDIDIVFVDSMSKVMIGDENKTQDVSHLLHDMHMLSEQLGTGWVTIHHVGKSEGYNGLSKMRGSVEFGTQSDNAFSMATIGEKIILKQEKGRYEDKKIDAINFSVTSTNGSMVLEYIGLAKDEAQRARKDKKERIRNEVIDYFIASPKEEYKVKDIIDHLHLPDTLARDIIYRDKDSLHHQNIIEYDGYGKAKFLTRSEPSAEATL